MTERARERHRRVRRRPFSLAAELQFLAVGLFAVAAAAAWLSRGTSAVAPVDVLGAAGVIVAMFGVNVAVGLLSARRAARDGVDGVVGDGAVAEGGVEG